MKLPARIRRHRPAKGKPVQQAMRGLMHNTLHQFHPAAMLRQVQRQRPPEKKTAGATKSQRPRTRLAFYQHDLIDQRVNLRMQRRRRRSQQGHGPGNPPAPFPKRITLNRQQRNHMLRIILNMPAIALRHAWAKLRIIQGDDSKTRRFPPARHRQLLDDPGQACFILAHQGRQQIPIQRYNPRPDRMRADRGGQFPQRRQRQAGALNHAERRVQTIRQPAPHPGIDRQNPPGIRKEPKIHRYRLRPRTCYHCSQMIVFLAVRHHLYTVDSLCSQKYGPALPVVRAMAYETAFIAQAFHRATYIFTDIERLTNWERMLAADLYRALRDAGCRCLNDPARVLTRYPLLRRLHREGRNPFNVWRLEDGLDNPNFPVFLRHEADHGHPLTGLLETPTALAAAQSSLEASGLPLAGLLGVEFCAAPFAPGIWTKFGTFRIGETLSTDHAVIEDNWCVKYGVDGLATPEIFQWEYDHVAANSFAQPLRPAFELAAIEYGRADHTTVNGREVVFEINTNPHLVALSPQKSPVRDAMVQIARARYSAALWEIDTEPRGPIKLQLSERAAYHRSRTTRMGTHYRP